MRLLKTLLIAAAATSLLWPAAAAKEAGAKRVTRVAAPSRTYALKTYAPTTYTSKRAAKQRRHNYGFLPGYRQPPNLSDWRDRRPGYGYRAHSGPYEMRYWTYDGRLLYGWGGPGFYRGRWNGGSMGPCWTSTPIGFMWNCGR